MEILLLVFLLAMTGKNSYDLKNSLNSALTFYRENRELIAMLSSMRKNSAPQQAEEVSAEQTKTESAPFADPVGLFEQYLKTHAS